MSRPWLVIALVAAVVAPASALAQDGVYGRLRGDLVLSVEVLGGASSRAAGTHALGSVAVRARYLDMTGVALGYDRSFGGERHDALWAAVDFRPVFLARFAYDLARGPRWLDLMLDSIGVELGAAWIRPGEALQNGGGFGLVVGTGVELPLAWSNGRGLTLRLAARWIDAPAYNAQGTGASDGAFEFGGGLVLRTITRAGLVGAHD